MRNFLPEIGKEFYTFEVWSNDGGIDYNNPHFIDGKKYYACLDQPQWSIEHREIVGCVEVIKTLTGEGSPSLNLERNYVWQVKSIREKTHQEDWKEQGYVRQEFSVNLKRARIYLTEEAAQEALKEAIENENY